MKEDNQVVRINLNSLSLSDNTEYNILLIGIENESKTTFINSFSNYVKSVSLGKAKDGKLEKSMLSTFDRTQNLYTFRLNSKLIRIIDIPENNYRGPFDSNDDMRAIRKCSLDYPRLHAIVIAANVNERLFFDYNYPEKLMPLLFLPIIHKSACNNVVMFFTSKRTFEFGDNTLAQLQSYIRRYTKIQAPKHGQNLLTFALKCFDEPTKQNKTSRIESSEQIQTMFDWVESGEPCEMTNVVELTQAYQILIFSIDIGIAYYDFKDYPIYDPKRIQAEFLKQNPTEYERFEVIFLKLWALVMHLTMIQPFLFVEDISKHLEDEQCKNIKEFFKKLLHVSENCQSVKVKLRQCSATEYFHELFNDLYKLPHIGPYFVNRIKVQFSSNELEQLLSILTKNNFLFMKLEGKAKRDLSNVTFSCDCDLTSRVFDLFYKNSTTFSNINQEDIQFVLENIDSTIKYNLDNLFCVIRDYLKMEDDVIHE